MRRFSRWIWLGIVPAAVAAAVMVAAMSTGCSGGSGGGSGTRQSPSASVVPSSGSGTGVPGSPSSSDQSTGSSSTSASGAGSGNLVEDPVTHTIDLDLGKGVKLVLKHIPAKGNKFWMGSPETEKERNDNETQHRVEFSHDYYLGEWKVTQAQYQAVIGKNPSLFSKGGGAEKVQGINTDDFPVESVSLDDAKAFCDLLTKTFNERGYEFRLPTEAEWEYACRGGDSKKDTAPFYLKNGASASLSGGQVNFNGNNPYGGAKGEFLKRTSKCGSYSQAVNAFGLWDMHGNVRERCADYYDPKFYNNSVSVDPLCDKEDPQFINNRVLRGGSYFYNGSYCRAAYRNQGAADYRYFQDAGFGVGAVRTR